MYIAKSALMQLSVPSAPVPWFKRVWGKKHVSRLAFILWLACRKRLNTNDGLISWVLKGNQDVFCSSADEDLKHLFFLCPFSHCMGDCAKKVSFI